MAVFHSDHQLEVARAHPLTYTKFESEAPVKKAMLISSATAVPRQFYRKFAQFFASKGFVVYTFDYSGIGDSGSTPDLLKAHQGGVKGWGNIDQAQMIKKIREEYPDKKMVMITHSIGGQILGFNPLHHELEKVVMVASQGSYWRMYEGMNILKLGLFWYFFIPFFTAIFGYYPGTRLKIFENLPKSMVKEWRSWGTKKEYFMHYRNQQQSHYFFDQIKIPLRLYSFAQDAYASKRGVDWLAKQFDQAKVERIHYSCA